VSNFSRLLVSLITVAQLIKAGLITAKQALTQTGLQLAITVRQTLQLAKLNQLQNNALVVKMKLALLRLKGSSYVLVRIVHQLTQVGLKFLGTVLQRQQRARRQNYKGH
jgi:hypothetical protein